MPTKITDSQTVTPSKRAPAASAHGRSIQPTKPRSALRRKPYGTVPPHIARVEGIVEALCALIGTAHFEAEQVVAERHILRARINLRRQLRALKITVETFEHFAERLDAAEHSIADAIAAHVRHLEEAVVPEVRRCAQVASKAVFA